MKTWKVFLSGLALSLVFFSCQKDEEIPAGSEELSKTDAQEFADVKMCKDVYPEGTLPRAAALKDKVWSNGRTLTVRFYGGTDYVREKVEQYANEWSDYANIRFQFVQSGKADIRVSFNEGDGSWSYIGTDANLIRGNRATMNFGWFDNHTDDEEFSRTTIHEFGHALGLIHEHQHPEADIPWNKEKVYEYYGGAPNYWTKEQVDNNLFAAYSKTQTQYSEYDPESIMHYAISKELTDGIFEVGWNTTLSETDKYFMSALYPKP